MKWSANVSLTTSKLAELFVELLPARTVSSVWSVRVVSGYVVKNDTSACHGVNSSVFTGLEQ